MQSTIIRQIESALITFVAFFLVDLGTTFQTLVHQPITALTGAAVWALVIAAARAAAKIVWENFLKSFFSSPDAMTQPPVNR